MKLFYNNNAINIDNNDLNKGMEHNAICSNG